MVRLPAAQVAAPGGELDLNPNQPATRPPDREQHPRCASGGAAGITGWRSVVDSTDLAARARRHDYAVRVVSERRDGVLVTQLYTNLPAAERKVLRVREAGLRAELSLVRLVPVGIAPDPLVPSVEALADLLGEGDR